MTISQSGLNRRWILRGGLLAGIGAATVGPGLLLTPSPANAVVLSGQEGWRWCRQCQGLFYFGSRFDPHFGRCPAGDVHTTVDSYPYALAYTTDPSAPASPGWQHGWRHCRTCMGLSYIQDGVGRCPGPAGYHDHTGSHSYHLSVGAAGFSEQDQWRWCDRCQGLFFGLGQLQSRCPQTTLPHRIGPTSLNYVLRHR